MVFSSGYEEVHQIDKGFCAHITNVVIDRDWRITATSVDHTLRFRVAFAGEAGYFAGDSRVSDAIARCAYIVRPPGESLTANFKGGSRLPLLLAEFDSGLSSPHSGTHR